MHAGSIKQAGPINAALGRRIRTLRLTKGVSQAMLARRLGVAVQKIQKYEKGACRIGVGRLIEIAAVLRLPLNALLQQVDRGPRPGPADDPVARLSHRQAVRLAKAFAKLAPRHHRPARSQAPGRGPTRSRHAAAPSTCR